jgi:hypothetical protein
MASIDRYVDADTGADGNTGVDWANAKEHLSAALDLFTPPITDNITIHLKENTTAAYEESATSNILSINGFRCVDGGSIEIIPGNWTESNYTPETSPIGGSGFDPTEDKPCNLTYSIAISNSNDITIRGMNIQAGTGFITAVPGIQAGNRSFDIAVHYCTIDEFDICARAINYSMLYIYNSLIDVAQNVGGAAEFSSYLIFAGDNYIQDAQRYGVAAYVNSTVGFYPWPGYLVDAFTTKISTSSPRKKYTAALASINSVLMVRADVYQQVAPEAGLLKIIDELSSQSSQNKDYSGVKLHSKSMFSGAGNVRFAEAGLNDDKDTVSPGQQFVQMAGEDTTVSE